MTTPIETPRSRRRLWIWLVGGALAVSGVAVGVVVLLTPPSEEDRAIRFCQERVVRPELRAPSAADFLDGATAERNRWTPAEIRVRGEFDALNGFGATIRGSYVCDVRWQGDGWFVISKTIR